MKLFRKIDTTTGDFIEDALFESHPFLMEERTVEYLDELDELVQYGEWVPVLDVEGNPQLDPQYIEEAPQQGFYLPRWTGTEWVEGGVAPDPVPPVSTEVERLAAIEETLDFLLMGGM